MPELDCYRIEFGNVAGRIMSHASHARNAFEAGDRDTAVSRIDDAYEEIKRYEESELGILELGGRFRKHLDRVKEILHRST